MGITTIRVFARGARVHHEVSHAMQILRRCKTVLKCSRILLAVIVRFCLPSNAAPLVVFLAYVDERSRSIMLHTKR